MQMLLLLPLLPVLLLPLLCQKKSSALLKRDVPSFFSLRVERSGTTVRVYPLLFVEQARLGSCRVLSLCVCVHTMRGCPTRSPVSLRSGR